MIRTALLGYLDFVRSPLGSLAIVLLAVALCVGIGLWVRQNRADDRLPLVLTAGTLTGFFAAVYGLAVTAGWWRGAYFQMSPIVQASTLLPLSLLGWLAWLRGYIWLAARTRYAVLTYALIGLLM